MNNFDVNAEMSILFNSFPDIMSVEQLQSAIGVGRSTAYKLVNTGEIRSFRIGTSVKIPKTSLLDYIANAVELCYSSSSSGRANTGCQKGARVL